MDPAEIWKYVSTTIPVVGDVRQVLLQLMEHCPVAETRDLEGMLEKRQAELHRELPSRAGYAHPARVIRELGEQMKDDATICVDVGQNQIWTCKHLKIKNGRFLTTGGLGTMGYSLPAALGAYVADPNRELVVVCGDGSFQMFENELSTLRNLGAPVKIVLMRNNVLGLVNQIQKSSYSGPFGVALEHSPDFHLIADAYGIRYGSIGEDAEIEAAVQTMLSAEGPYILDVRVDPDASTDD